jgi:hypothetical protein
MVDLHVELVGPEVRRRREGSRPAEQVRGDRVRLFGRVHPLFDPHDRSNSGLCHRVTSPAASTWGAAELVALHTVLDRESAVGPPLRRWHRNDRDHDDVRLDLAAVGQFDALHAVDAVELCHADAG